MPREKKTVWMHFQMAKNDKNANIVCCKYCNKSYTFPNATRMEKHLEKCNKYSTVNKEGSIVIEIEEDITADTTLQPVQPVASSSTLSDSSVTQSLKRSKSGSQRISSYFDSISSAEREKADKAFAKAVYAGGLPFSVFENNPLFHEAFSILRPSYVPPNTHALRSSLLNFEYEAAKLSIEQRLSKASCITVMSDGWTNICGEGIVNVLLGTPDIVFYSAITPGEQKENAEFIAHEFLKVIRKIDSNKVLLLVTDNAAVMKAAWKIVRTEFPHIFTIGCGAHGLNLLAKDLMKIPFLNTIRNQARKVIKLKRKRLFYAVFKNEQTRLYGKNAKSLKLSNPTRFSGDALMFESLLSNKTALQATVISDKLNGNDIDSSVKSEILSDNFWKDCSIALQLLKPIAKAIGVLESNSAFLSLVPRMFMDIIAKYTDFFKECTINSVVQNTIFYYVKNRMNFILYDIHKTTYLLDPRFHGQGLSDLECLDCLELISSLASFLGLDVTLVRENVVLYRSEEHTYSQQLLVYIRNKITAAEKISVIKGRRKRRMAGSKADCTVRLKISGLQDQRRALFHRPFTCRTPWILTL
ncbi:PREDICTED: uncharacterized protein LOC105462588 [Wasmannia auropunctata]|uniref:uncharacterized protein LOC105462588 n=1 Tax=Wasmannia auropunctata TaxID=64793 RepID=UPI0005EFA5EA|nr:PREDICTED: uncharacterized protein LOC105462588 [Wasmannia auropunctata]